MSSSQDEAGFFKSCGDRENLERLAIGRDWDGEDRLIGLLSRRQHSSGEVQARPNAATTDVAPLSRSKAGVIQDSEQLLDVTTGLVEVERMGQRTSRNGTVAVTDRRVILFTKKLGGYDVQDYAYGLLTSVDHKRGVVWGNLDLAAAGDRSRVSQVDKNEIRAHRTGHPPADGRGTKLRIASARSRRTGPCLTNFESLGRLGTTGSFSEEEFQERKRQLLGL